MVSFTNSAITREWYNTFVTKGLDVTISENSILLNAQLVALDKEKITHFLPQSSKNISKLLKIIYQTTSTNTEIRNSDSVQILVAEFQSSGKGRNNRNWVSPIGHNIYLSIKFTNFDNDNISFLPVYLSLLLAESLTNLGLNDVSIKWPNDLYISGNKVSGSILEFYTSNISNTIIIGIGINVTMPVYDHAEIDQPYTSISKHGDKLLTDRNYLLATILPSLYTSINTYQPSKIPEYLKRFDTFNYLKGKDLLIKERNSEYLASYKSINYDGSLQVIKDNQLVNLYAADVSVRPDNY